MDDKPPWLQELEDNHRKVMQTSADLLAHGQDLDALEAQHASITDENVRAQLALTLSQMRVTDTIIGNQNALQHSISNAYGALVALAERIAAIEQRLDES